MNCFFVDFFCVFLNAIFFPSLSLSALNIIVCTKNIEYLHGTTLYRAGMGCRVGDLSKYAHHHCWYF